MFGLKGILPSIRGCNFQERKCLRCPDQFFVPLCLDSGNFWPLMAIEADFAGRYHLKNVQFIQGQGRRKF
jgi:hypothetical protein